ncbi:MULTISPECIES: hypothetical protein [unclassified Rhizobium]|uniref:hypothetical protein n=1 Tax=unclassified Rhizobium TaxID=2613769 RepID=UPI000BCA81E4|nr:MULTISPECIES: hypothetical protein [unclassified Rhizobium]MDH7808847.1 hypothetical protein [Rhizobium sp. AN67]MDQ4409118.1 hypothetical protein [Rhizobium sp. AN63]SOD51052.1 hypothetical protein SAMN05216595_0511 [Rhizobium sp. AN6A]
MDAGRINELLALAEGKGLGKARKVAAEALGTSPSKKSITNGCALTLSHMLHQAGADIPLIDNSGQLAKYLEENRDWKRVAVGSHRRGDVGVTYDTGGVDGADHIFLILGVLGNDEVLTADNQDVEPHPRSLKNVGTYTETEYFLRASW